MAGLIHFFEWLLVMLFNGKRSERPRALPAMPEPIPDGFVIGKQKVLAPGDVAGNPIVISLAVRARPNYIVGNSGGGKTNTIILLILWEISRGVTVVFIDMRGDAVAKILRFLAGAGVAAERIGVIDLARDDRTTECNFLGTGGDPYRLALPILGFLRERTDLGPQTEDALRCCLVACAEIGGSLLDVERLLTNEAFLRDSLPRIRDEYTRGYFERYLELSNERRTAITLPCLNKLAPLIAAPALRRMIGGNGAVDIPALLNAPGQVLLVSLAVDIHHEGSHLIGTLLIGAIERAILSRSGPESGHVAVRIIVDEFENFAGESFHALIQEARRFGASVTLSHQSQCQLDPKTRALIRNNAAMKAFFGVGSIDAGELAAEITNLPREQARAALMGLSPGEAVVVQTGKAPVAVSTALAEEPDVSDEEVAALAEAGVRRLSRPTCEVEAEMAARRDLVAAMTKASSPEATEVRHSRKPRVQ